MQRHLRTFWFLVRREKSWIYSVSFSSSEGVFTMEYPCMLYMYPSCNRKVLHAFCAHMFPEAVAPLSLTALLSSKCIWHFPTRPALQTSRVVRIIFLVSQLGEAKCTRLKAQIPEPAWIPFQPCRLPVGDLKPVTQPLCIPWEVASLQQATRSKMLRT